MTTESPARTVRLGVVLPPGAAADRATGPGGLEGLARELPGDLADRLGVPGWDVIVVQDPLVPPTSGVDDLVRAARERLVQEGWDLVVVLTDLPLEVGRRTVVTSASPLHGVGLLSVPALGPVGLRRGARRGTVRLVEALLGGDGTDPDAVAARVRELQDDDDVEDSGNPVVLTARVLGGNLRVLLGMVRVNQPWRLALGLSRALTAAVAAAVLALITPDVWVLADAYGPVRLALLAVGSVVVTAVTLLVGARLWERAPEGRGRPGARRQVALFNTATTVTVLIGVTALYAALLVLSVAASFALVVPSVMADTVGSDVGPVDLLRLAWFTTTLATVAGALGAGLEDDDTVRAAAYAARSAQVDVERDADTDRAGG
ncbi:hypothetical protein [Aquipuribacter sp. SD81]|uniref:hypothetical protein n=1 Tax=Aquipuribacter sp. SD81 TaxID=3127703 RepID=UPI00301A39DA